MLSARGDAGLVKGSKDKSSGQRRFGGFKHPSCSEHKQTAAPGPLLYPAHGRSSECPQPTQPADPRNLPPLRLEQFTRAQHFHQQANPLMALAGLR